MKNLGVIWAANIFLVVLLASDGLFGKPLPDRVSDEVSSSLRSIEQIDVSIGQILFGGVVIPDSIRERSWYIPSVFELVQYNTVEGFVFNPKLSIIQQLKGGKFYAIKPNLRYGFGRERLLGKVAATYYYNPSRFGSFALNGGKFVRQFDRKSTLSPFANSYSTLIFQENFLKIYESTFVEMGHSFSPIKNMQLTNHVFWSSRTALENLEDLNDHGYTPNDPVNSEIDFTTFDRHQVFYQKTEIRWQPDLNYEYLRGKWVPTSKHLAVLLKYKSAHSEVFGSGLSYHNIALGIEVTIQMDAFGEAHFNLEGGDFISKDSLSFVDFTHFQGNRTTYTAYEQGTFQLLDYYSLSTTGSYFRGHYTHTFKTIKNWFTPILEGSYLHASGSDYVELGVGMQRDTKPFRVSFYNSWLDGKHDRTEVRIGFLFP